MSRRCRVALTETANAYRPMPAELADLPSLADRLEEVRQANVAHAIELLAQAAAAGTQVACLGELFTAPYFALTRDPMWRALAEDALSGPTVTALRPVARQHQLIVVAPIYELDPNSGRRFNAAVILDERGEVIGKYRKCHIPEGTNEQATFSETFYYDASDGQNGDWPANVSENPYFPVVQTARCRLGVAICYDRHFPGVIRSLAEAGAELVVCPAVTFGAKSAWMWDREFEVDAVRHNLFIAGSNRRGSEPPWNQPYFGRSYLVGPNGRPPPVPSPNDALMIADLDFDELSAPDGSGWNLARDRRPDIYD